MRTVWIRRLSSRIAPDGSWSAGDEHEVELIVARLAIASGLAELVVGGAGLELGVETAAMETPETASLRVGSPHGRARG